MGLGATELIVILLIVVLLFGASKIPELGKSVGQGIKSFKDGLRQEDDPPAPPPRRNLEEGRPPPVKAEVRQAEPAAKPPADGAGDSEPFFEAFFWPGIVGV